jgi:hypothetical protein
MQLWATGCVGTWFAICKRGPAGASDLLLDLGVWPGQSLCSPQPRTLFQALVYKSKITILINLLSNHGNAREIPEFFAAFKVTQFLD